MKSKEDILTYQWNDTGCKPNDLTCLVLNIMLFYFCHLASIDCKLYMSMSGNNIYLAMKCDEWDLARAAEQTRYLMQFSVGGTDLMSLEPCNSKLF